MEAIVEYKGLVRIVGLDPRNLGSLALSICLDRRSVLYAQRTNRIVIFNAPFAAVPFVHHIVLVELVRLEVRDELLYFWTRARLLEMRLELRYLSWACHWRLHVLLRVLVRKECTVALSSVAQPPIDRRLFKQETFIVVLLRGRLENLRKVVHGLVSIRERSIALFDLWKSDAHIICLKVVVEVRAKIFVI